MGALNRFIALSSKVANYIWDYGVTAPQSESDVPSKNANWTGFGTGNYQPIYPMQFDGEKNLGESGPIRQYFLDYYRLRLRSRQLYIESEICKAVIDKRSKWVIGKGLSLKAEPQIDVLKIEGINIDPENFNNNVESLWKMYSNSVMPDITGKMTLQQLSDEAETEQSIGGDILVMLSVEGLTVKVRHIDGCHIVTPPTLVFNGCDYLNEYGNRVRHGVELDSKGRRVAYYVRTDLTGLNYTRIEAYGKQSGMLMAYLYVGDKYTVDSERGMPLIISVMETAKKMERYTSAALGGAEERQKIALFIEHELNASNEDPMIGRRAKAYAGYGSNNIGADLAETIDGNKLAANVYASTNKTTINLPNGSTVKDIQSNQEANVKEFGMFNIDLICAAVDMPTNIALDKYEDSFSASRMSGKSWEQTFTKERVEHGTGYLDPIYALQVYVWVVGNKIQAPGYLTALQQGNEYAINAYLHSRWVGDMFPDIDPLKTANYLRKMTGETMNHLPFMTLEDAVEYQNGGASDAVLRQTAKDLELADTLGIERIDILQVRVNEEDDQDVGKANDPKSKNE